MKKIFITGSSDGLGSLAANALIEQGHSVYLHARNEARGREALEKAPGAEGILISDLSSVTGARELAGIANEVGRFDSVIHNAAVYRASGKDILTVNILAPYVLTSLMHRPDRLIYMSSGMHGGGNTNFELFTSDADSITYSDSKLYMVMFANAVARHWSDVRSNSLDPGWVPTKMGGENAPDSLKDGYSTQVWLAASNDQAAEVSGRYFKHMKEVPHNPQADNIESQERFLQLCGEVTGVRFPES